MMFVIFFYFTINFFLYSQELIEQNFRKDYKKSYNFLKQSSLKNPKSIDILLKLANVSSILKMKNETKKIYKNILSISNKNRQAIKSLAFLYAQEGRIERARETIKPLLNQFDPIVILTEALIQINLKNYKRAIYELQEAKKNGLNTLELNKILVQAYIISNRIKQADEKLKNLIQENPKDSNLFLLRAQNYLKVASYSDTKQVEEVVKAENDLNAATLIDPFYEEARYLKSKIYIWQKNFEKANKVLDSLIQDFPKETKYKYLQSFIYQKRNENKKSERVFKEILALNPKEIYARYQAENFAINRLELNSVFRINLSKYRLQQYQSNQFAFLYDVAKIQLKRANQLSPDKYDIQKKLLKLYKEKKDFNLFLKVFYLHEGKRDLEYQLKLKSVLKYIKEQLSYKEKMIQLTTWGGVEKKYIDKKTKIFLFDPQNVKFLPEHPDISQIFYREMENAIRQNPNFLLVSKKERDNLFQKFNITRKNYTNELPFIRSIIGEQSDFYISSEIRNEIEPILEVTIWDSKKRKIQKRTIIGKGKNAIAEISVLFSNMLNENLPKTGNIIKIKNNSVLINLGKQNQIEKESIINIIDKEKKIWKAKVENLDFYVCEVVPERWDWRSYLTVGEKAIYMGKAEKDNS